MNNSAERQILLERTLAKREREKRQLQLLAAELDWKRQIENKLEGRWPTNQFANLLRCGREEIYCTCKGCRTVTRFFYNCHLKWCPACQWRLVHKRREILELWCTKISQPKHLILTQKNFPILTRTRIRNHKRNLAKIRRCKCWQHVRGGSVSVEITNEGNGWHLHSHWLIDCRWLDMKEISQTWGKLCGQEFAIVAVKDARNRDYISEVLKYVSKGNEIACWPPEQIVEFVEAIRGQRFFFTFGTLFKMQSQVRAELEAREKPPKICDCGCEDFIWETEEQMVAEEFRQLEKRKRR